MRDRQRSIPAWCGVVVGLGVVTTALSGLGIMAALVGVVAVSSALGATAVGVVAITVGMLGARSAHLSMLRDDASIATPSFATPASGTDAAQDTAPDDPVDSLPAPLGTPVAALPAPRPDDPTLPLRSTGAPGTAEEPLADFLMSMLATRKESDAA
ncbi:MAG: hypothetical protein R2698_02665 [Microthrixaceae bacterium]